MENLSAIGMGEIASECQGAREAREREGVRSMFNRSGAIEQPYSGNRGAIDRTPTRVCGAQHIACTVHDSIVPLNGWRFTDFK